MGITVSRPGGPLVIEKLGVRYGIINSADVRLFGVFCNCFPNGKLLTNHKRETSSDIDIDIDNQWMRATCAKLYFKKSCTYRI